MSKVTTNTPHDGLFKRIFSDPVHAEGIFRANLPPELVAKLDFATLELQAGSFIDKKLDGRHTDLLFKIQLGGHPLIFVLLEHQSTVDGLMSFRILVYIIRIWEAWIREHPEATTLPLVIPVVISHAVTGWTATTQVADLIDLSPELREILAPYIPTMRFVLDDLAQHSDTDLKARPMSPTGRTALFALKHGRDPKDITDELVAWADQFKAMLDAGNVEALTTIIRYVFSVNQTIEIEPMLERITPLLGQKMEAVVMSVGDRLREEGRVEGWEKGRVEGWEKGREEGRVEGRTEGRVEGQAKVLLTQIRLKFKTEDAAVIARVQAADAETLERWAAAILTAESLEELFK